MIESSIAFPPSAGLSWSRAAVASCGLALGVSILVSPVYATLCFFAALAALVCIFRPALAALALLAFLLFQDPLQILAGGDTWWALVVKRADEFMILGLGCRCLAICAVRRSFLERKLFLPIIGCYLGVLWSSVLQRADIVPATIDLVLFSKPFLFLAIGLNLALSDELIERNLERLTALFLALLAVGVLFLRFPELQQQYLGGLRMSGERVGFPVAQGMFIYPAVYSWLGVATFGIACAAYLTYARRRYFVYTILGALCVVLTWRRKSLIALAVILLAAIFVTRTRQSRVRAISLILLAGVVVALILAPYLSALVEVTVHEYGKADPYNNARVALYYTSFLIAKDHFPLGTGLASFGSHASRLHYSHVYRDYGLSELYGLSVRDSHYVTDTFWPMVLGQGGVVSLVSYAAFLLLLLAVAFGAARAAVPRSATHFLALASVFLLLGSFVESVASHFYGSSLQGALVFVPVAMCWRRHLRRPPQVAADPR